jgi:hypothetical protein
MLRPQTASEQILVANSEISTIHVRQVPENPVC